MDDGPWCQSRCFGNESLEGQPPCPKQQPRANHQETCYEEPGGQLPASQGRLRQNADADAEEVAHLLFVMRWGRGLVYNTHSEYRVTLTFP